MTNTKLSSSLLFYLAIWCATMACLILSDYIIIVYLFPFQFFTLFVSGGIVIILHHITRELEELFRWSLILIIFGLVFVIIGSFKVMFFEYIRYLIVYPYQTLGLTFIILGLVGILILVLVRIFILICPLLLGIKLPTKGGE